MSSLRRARHAGCLALLVGVAACAGSGEPSYPTPDDPGIYAITDDGGLLRLDGDPDWEAETWPDRADLPSDVQFVISDPALAGRSAGSSVELWKLAWVRSEINAQNQAMPVSGSQWAVAPMESFSVPFRYESPAGETDIVHIVPTGPLEPGRYSLRIVNPGAREGRVGVNWDSVDQRQYSAANCVDRYEAQSVYRPCTGAVGMAEGAVPPAGGGDASGVTPSGGLGSLSAPQTLPTVAAAPAPAPAAIPTPAQPAPVATGGTLQITLADPVRQNDGLVIQGVVINNTDQMQTVPSMQGSLEDQAGQEVRRWVFPPPVETLAPGARASFRTEVNPLPPGAARATVAFIAAP
ncbi:MAG TPA: DUF3426 domain-containing protein [Dongiaceae bacterium]|nr:DUF3426 domain-containing protein [Dongiaceae bacterium]